jgi:hypothetical protein
VAAIVTGVVMGVHEWWDDRLPGIQQGAVPSTLHSVWVAAMFLAFLGLSALQWRAFGRFGRVAARVAVVGTGLLFLLSLSEVWSLAHSNTTSEADPPLPMLVVMMVVFGCYVAGLLLFPLATIMAGVLPRAVGSFLLISVLLKLFASGVLPGTLALMGAAFATTGLTAIQVMQKDKGAGAERSPVSSTSANA